MLQALKAYALSAEEDKNILGCTRKRITSRSKEVMLPLYCAVVKHVGRYVKYWAPQYRTDTEGSSAGGQENDHRTGVSNERLRELQLFTLRRKLKVYLIHTYKCLTQGCKKK